MVLRSSRISCLQERERSEICSCMHIKWLPLSCVLNTDTIKTPPAPTFGSLPSSQYRAGADCHSVQLWFSVSSLTSCYFWFRFASEVAFIDLFISTCTIHASAQPHIDFREVTNIVYTSTFKGFWGFILLLQCSSNHFRLDFAPLCLIREVVSLFFSLLYFFNWVASTGVLLTLLTLKALPMKIVIQQHPCSY